MRRGEVWWVEFPEDAVGSEIRKSRPAVVLSNDLATRHLDRIQVVPLTTRTDRLYSGEAYVTVRGRRHKAMADQLSTVDKSRAKNRILHLTEGDLEAVERAVRIQLGLD